MKKNSLHKGLLIFGGALLGSGGTYLFFSIHAYLSATDYGKDIIRLFLFESFYVSIPLIVTGLIIILFAVFKMRLK